MSYAFDPELAAAIELLPKIDLTDLTAAREGMKKLLAEQPEPDGTGVTVTGLVVPGPAGAPDVPLRIYRPDTPSGPVGIYDVHGGGFILGDLDMVHASNLTLAREVGAVVVTVDYRLAPEHRYPAGLEDCYAGLVWFAEHAEEYGVDPARIAIHGISAGGGLCAALALLARDRGGPAIAFQYLGVPEVDDRLGTPSMTAYTDTPLWNRPNAVFSWDAYLGAGVPGSADVPVYAAPARATDLVGLPPAYVSAMEFDPLRDESVGYALALQAAGVQVELHMFPGTFHGSALVEHAAVSQREKSEAITVLRRGLQV
ncbi:MAG TPA: alpha/beta hydrolase [Pseudonocardia sp.]|nr:alpha/beta hydrolase [Pseudonocardia sp.]